MLKNYLKIALRNARRHPGYTFINVAGLAVGIACCCFIFLYVQDEFSYDQYHTNADRIVRIAEDLKTSSETLYQATSSPPMGAAFVEDFPEVLAKVRLLQEGYDKIQLEAKIPDFIERRIGEQARQIGMAYEQLPLIPLTDIHLTSHRTWELATNGNRPYLYIFSAVAVFILLIACVNFMNLATARAAERAKEVGLRKVVGAQRAQLAGQFLSESFLMTVLAMMLALGLCGLLMPVFNSLTEKSLTLGSLLQGTNAALLVGVVLLVGVIAGGYPALVLSGFRPVSVLKGQFRSSDRGTSLRKGLVVFQFATSMILIVGTAVVMQQLSYLQDQNLGFTQEQMLVINYNYDEDVQRHAEAIKQAFLTHPGVVGAAISYTTPGSEPTNLFTRVEVAEGEVHEANLNYYPVGLDFIDTYGLEMLAGRSFSRDFPPDTLESVVINEAMLAHFGWATPEAALDKTFTRDRREMKVIGVV